MKAIQIHEFVPKFERMEEFMTLEDYVDRPNPKTGEILIRVLACSISPADVNMTEGNFWLLHPTKFPFVPCMDVCGVVENPNASSCFKKGDIVVADNGFSPQGGMAEYMAIPANESVLKPKSVTTIEAAASSSAVTSRNAVLDHVRENDRVLVLGGSGGVGSAAISLAKHHAKASFVATTSTQTDMCKSLGADEVVNYKKTNWWEIQEFKLNKFDVIIDTVGAGGHFKKAPRVLKSRRLGGKFVAVVGDHPKPTAGTFWKAMKYVASLMWYPLQSATIGRWSLPKYILLVPHDSREGRKQILEMMDNKTLQIRLDPRTPQPFTKEGVCEAFRIVASGHAHGKIVVVLSDDSEFS